MDLSVVIPVHNEEKNLPILYQELRNVLGKRSYELIFVDDGSTDLSFSVLEALAKSEKRIRIIKLRSNYGQSTALLAGIEHAQGKVVVTMDADLQNDPADIPGLLEKLDQGYDVVCGWRTGRHKSDQFFFKYLPSRVFNKMVNVMTGTELHDSLGGMRAFRKEVFEMIFVYGEMHRFLPILAKWKGFKITEEKINIRKRKYGKTKYGVGRMMRGFLDLLTVKFFISYYSRPSHIFGSFGLFLGGLGFLGCLYLFLRKLITGIDITASWPLLLLSILFLILGVNFFSFGLIGDMISYDAQANNKRKLYLVEKIVGK